MKDNSFSLSATDKVEHLLWPDFVRAAGIFAMIVLHVAAVPVTHFNSLARSHWWWANGFDSLVRPCIPIFVMLSGAFLLTRPNWTAAYFIRRRVVRVLVPFVAWSAIYACWKYFLHNQSTTPGAFLYHLASGMSDPVYPHLWFVPLILSLYLLVPIFRPYVQYATSLRSTVYFSALWIIATIVIPVAASQFDFQIGYSLTPLFGYVGYFVMGGMLYAMVARRFAQIWTPALLSVSVLGFAGTMWGTYAASVQAGRLDEFFYSYLSPTVIPMSVATYIVLSRMGMRLQSCVAETSSVKKSIAAIGGASFGMYLIHMIVLESLTYGILGFVLGPLVFHPAIAIPFTSLVVFIVSLLLVLLMRTTVLLRWLCP